MSHFNYIITCHNAEATIERVLHGVSPCCRTTDNVVVVLDGCSDGTEDIVVAVADLLGLPTNIVRTPDVHELLSLNAGLRYALQGDGYNVLLQDDVILMDPDLEAHIEAAYATIPNLGYLSLRAGFNLREDAYTHAAPYPVFPQTEDIESVYGSGITANILMPGRFTYRTMPIKSPTVLPCKIVRELGVFNENLAPYAYDDLDMSIRCLMSGYSNGVLSVPFFSDVRWGGSRKRGHPDIMVAVLRNGAYLRDRWGEQLYRICTGPQKTDQIQVFPSTQEADEAAMRQWNQSVETLKGIS